MLAFRSVYIMWNLMVSVRSLAKLSAGCLRVLYFFFFFFYKYNIKPANLRDTCIQVKLQDNA